MRTKRIKLVAAIAALSLLLAYPVNAEIKLPAIVSSNMVLQRNATVVLWGWAEPECYLEFKAVDKAGNNELIKGLLVKVDKDGVEVEDGDEEGVDCGEICNIECEENEEPAPPKVIYDNDGLWESSGTADFFYMVLASQGAIDLRGIITSTSLRHLEDIAPNRWPYPPMSDEDITSERQAFIEKARRSGLRNIPDVIAGPTQPFDAQYLTGRPFDGSMSHAQIDAIIDTLEPYTNPDDSLPGSDGARRILQEALSLLPGEKLYVCFGGETSVLADAWLLANDQEKNILTDRIIVISSGGKQRGTTKREITAAGGVNFAVDQLAALIVAQKFDFRLMTYRQWPPPSGQENPDQCPVIEQNCIIDGYNHPSFGLLTLPDTEIRQALYEKWWEERKWDYDGRVPVLLLHEEEYTVDKTKVEFDRWVSWGTYYTSLSKDASCWRETASGSFTNFLDLDGDFATKKFWEYATNPTAWHPVDRQTPFGRTPQIVPGKIEFEHFDHGGDGYGYHDMDVNHYQARSNGWPNNYENPRNTGWVNVNTGSKEHAYRLMENVDLDHSIAASSNYVVSQTKAGEWLTYTIDVPYDGDYEVKINVAVGDPNAQLHIIFDGTESTGIYTISDTGGWNTYQEQTIGTVYLSAGEQSMTVWFDQNSNNGYVGKFDYIELVATGPQPPVITSHPASETVKEGSNVDLSVTVTGTQPMTYSWTKDGTPIGSIFAAVEPRIKAVVLSVPATEFVTEQTPAGRVMNSSNFLDPQKYHTEILEWLTINLYLKI